MILDHVSRPVVIFDPCNKEHRAHYATFIKTNTWGKSPVRFVIDDPTGAANTNIAYSIQRLISEYYILQEFTESQKTLN